MQYHIHNIIHFNHKQKEKTHKHTHKVKKETPDKRDENLENIYKNLNGFSKIECEKI